MEAFGADKEEREGEKNGGGGKADELLMPDCCEELSVPVRAGGVINVKNRNTIMKLKTIRNTCTHQCVCVGCTYKYVHMCGVFVCTVVEMGGAFGQNEITPRH